MSLYDIKTAILTDLRKSLNEVNVSCQELIEICLNEAKQTSLEDNPINNNNIEEKTDNKIDCHSSSSVVKEEENTSVQCQIALSSYRKSMNTFLLTTGYIESDLMVYLESFKTQTCLDKMFPGSVEKKENLTYLRYAPECSDYMCSMRKAIEKSNNEIANLLKDVREAQKPSESKSIM